MRIGGRLLTCGGESATEVGVGASESESTQLSGGSVTRQEHESC
mgnify:CR=1 FL=1